jgi:hypothetical protein
MRADGRLFLDGSPIYGGPGFSSREYAEITGQRGGPLVDWAVRFYEGQGIPGVLDQQVTRAKRPAPAICRFSRNPRLERLPP